MPRRARVFLPEVPLHSIPRGNNRQACFYAEEDYGFYLDCLLEYAVKTRCQIHAYVLMTNHVHLLATAVDVQGAGALMKALGQRYVQYVNRRYRRSGTLWEERFRSCLTEEESYLLHALHRTKPGAGGDGFAPSRVPLVQLPSQRTGRGERSGVAARPIPCLG
jgi:putative transposase